MPQVECVETTNASSPRQKGITGSTLKIIAMICMLLDHIGFFLLDRVLVQRGLLEINSQQSFDLFRAANSGLYLTHDILRILGKIAFPIFCFLLVQGFIHTRNLKKYAGRLLLFAFISELPFNLAASGKLFLGDYQNVYFTLFLGILALAGIRRAEENREWHLVWRILFGLVSILLCAGAAVVLRTDYDMSGVLIIAILYLLRRKRMLSMALGCVVLWKIPPFVSLLPIYLYNGQRGSNMKWIFYLFYPVHILLLYLLACILNLGQISLV